MTELVSKAMLDNLIAAKKNIEEYQKALERAKSVTFTTSDTLRKLEGDLVKANAQYKEANFCNFKCARL